MTNENIFENFVRGLSLLIYMTCKKTCFEKVVKQGVDENVTLIPRYRGTNSFYEWNEVVQYLFLLILTYPKCSVV